MSNLNATRYMESLNASRVPANTIRHSNNNGIHNSNRPMTMHNLNQSLYVTSLLPTRIDNSIKILKDYIRLKDRLNKEHRIDHLKEAIEEIEKEIEEVRRINGGVRYKRRRTHKRAVRRNKTRARK